MFRYGIVVLHGRRTSISLFRSLYATFQHRYGLRSRYFRGVYYAKFKKYYPISVFYGQGATYYSRREEDDKGVRKVEAISTNARSFGRVRIIRGFSAIDSRSYYKDYSLVGYLSFWDWYDGVDERLCEHYLATRGLIRCDFYFHVDWVLFL